MLSSMRLMGIDYGTLRVGAALTDEGGSMAFPHATYENDDALLDLLITLARDEQVGAVVVGYSIDRDGVPNPIQRAIDMFVAQLQTALGVPIHLEEERYSTQAALRLQGRTAQTDASAAALILDSFITRTRNAR